MEATSEQIENLPKVFFFASPFCFEQSIEHLHRSAPAAALSAKKVHCHIPWVSSKQATCYTPRIRAIISLIEDRHFCCESIGQEQCWYAWQQLRWHQCY